jgi:hypothetical protein
LREQPRYGAVEQRPCVAACPARQAAPGRHDAGTPWNTPR